MGAEVAWNAAARVLRSAVKAPKSMVPKAKRTPSGYLIFSQQKRGELAQDAAFSTMKATEKMQHLAARAQGS